MNHIAGAKLQLTICAKCLGCNRIEDENFAGYKYCKAFIKA